jgi:hypothetical protein
MPVASRADGTEGEPPDTALPSGDPPPGEPGLPDGAAPDGAAPDGAAPGGTATHDADPGGTVLAAERAHLRRSRECLALMRADVLSLRALGGDPVSEEYLKAELYHRAEALRDMPDAPLFFGRLDYAPGDTGTGPGAGDAAAAGETFHIGRRHVHDPDGRPVVIDWRAPVSRPFYRASQADPMGLLLRRRFGFSGGTLTAYEDEPFRGTPATTPSAGHEAGTTAGPAGYAGRAGSAPASRLLIEEIERPRSGPMRDIVATIAPDQDDIVRAGADQTVCVQGAPGTGKTAVGLHRVAYLLYAYRERVTRRGVLVIGPNRAFLSYIRGVLPALGETGVRQVTVADLVASVPVRGTDSAAAATVKGDARMAEVLRRALWSQVAGGPGSAARLPASEHGPAEPVRAAGAVAPAGPGHWPGGHGEHRAGREAIVLPRGSRRWRVAPYELDDLVAELRGRGVRYGAGRELLGHRIAHLILTKMEASGEACDDRTHDAVRRARPVRAAVDAIWPKADPVRLVLRLLSDRAALAAAADGLLSEAEQEAIRWQAPPRGPGSARWSAADAVLIDEARDLIERTPSLSHVVVDEAQDLSPMECRAIGRRCSTGSATVLGDLAQGTTPWAAADWADVLGHLGKPDAVLYVLGTGYRVPRQILSYAGRLLPHIGPDLTPPVSLREDPGALEVITAGRDGAEGPGSVEGPGGSEGLEELEGLGRRLAAACERACARPGSVAVIAADRQAGEVSRLLARAGVSHAMPGGGDPVPGGEGAVPGEAGGEDHGETGLARRLTLVPATLAKGLEFDHVIVVEPGRIADAEPRGLQRLYVALTRAVSRLTVLHAEPLPGPLLLP